MKDLSEIEHLIEDVWQEPLHSELLSRKMDVSIYSGLSQQIPDKHVTIEEVFPKSELEDIWSNFEAHLSEYQIFPFLGTLGEAVICVGYGDNNKGKLFYFDFDFGSFQLDNDDLEGFIGKLVVC